MVVRLERVGTSALETIRDAATLALLAAATSEKREGDVIYAAKMGQKAKGQPGAVTVTQERSIYVTLDKTASDGLKSRLTGHPSLTFLALSPAGCFSLDSRHVLPVPIWAPFFIPRVRFHILSTLLPDQNAPPV